MSDENQHQLASLRERRFKRIVLFLGTVVLRPLAVAVAVYLSVGYMNSRPSPQWDGRYVYTCIEFDRAEDLKQFRIDVAQMKSARIPKGSTLSNKSAKECSGVHIGSNT
jgi:hypothetical protein